MNSSIAVRTETEAAQQQPDAGSLAKIRRRPVVAKVHRVNASEIYAKAPDADIAGFRTRLKQTLGSNSPLFVEASLRSLISAAKLPGEPTASTTSLSASLELIASLAPENEAQSALAIHVACLHLASLNVLSRIHCVTERNVIAMAAAGAKLERAFQSSLEAYHRVKRGATQIVRVERVEVQPGAQALIRITQ